MDQILVSTFSAPGIDWRPFKEAVGRLAIEITESAVLGCFEPKPISSCYDDELPRTRQAILRARDGRLAGFRYQVNRNAFLVACHDYADKKPEEHLLIGYGFRHGTTTKVESLHHVLGETGSVRLPDAVAHFMWDNAPPWKAFPERSAALGCSRTLACRFPLYSKIWRQGHDQ